MHMAGSTGGCLTSAPWLIQLSSLIPRRLNRLGALTVYAEEAMRARRSGSPPAEPDVMSHLLDAGLFYKDAALNDKLLTGDARLLIVAGSDTTASTLVHAFWHIARDEHVAERIRDELAHRGISRDADVSVTGLQGLEYLNAVVSETLRLHPATPGGVYRYSPDDGVVVGGQRLPGGVKIVGPMHTIQRCEFSHFVVGYTLGFFLCVLEQEDGSVSG